MGRRQCCGRGADLGVQKNVNLVLERGALHAMHLRHHTQAPCHAEERREGRGLRRSVRDSSGRVKGGVASARAASAHRHGVRGDDGKLSAHEAAIPAHHALGAVGMDLERLSSGGSPVVRSKVDEREPARLAVWLEPDDLTRHCVGVVCMDAAFIDGEQHLLAFVVGRGAQHARELRVDLCARCVRGHHVARGLHRVHRLGVEDLVWLQV